MSEVRDRLRSATEFVPLPERPFERLLERRDRRRRGQRVASTLVAFAIAAAAVGGSLFVLSRLGQDQVDTGGGWHSTKALALQPGEYFYLRVESSDLGDGHIRHLETWWALDGSGEVRNRSSRQDKYPYPATGIYGEGDFPVGLHNVELLSTDPAVLSTQLGTPPWDWGEPPESERRWDIVTMLVFETPYATPELRAALFEIASRLDGVVVTEEADPVGRPAVVLRRSDDDAGATWRLYFDPATHQALGWRYTSTRGGDVWQVLESGVVDRRSERPEAEQWLAPPLPGDLP